MPTAAVVYAPENYRPRPLAFDEQVTREVARSASAGARPVLADRWSTETRCNYRPPSRGGQPAPEVAVEPTPAPAADAGAVVPATEVAAAPAEAAVAYADPCAAGCPGADGSERPPFTRFNVRSKNAYVTGASRPKPEVMLPKRRCGTRPISTAIGAPGRIATQLDSEARMPAHVRPIMVDQPDSGRAAAAALRQPRVASRYAAKPNAAARGNAGPTTRAGISEIEANARRSAIARAQHITARDAAAQTETDGTVAVVGDEARHLYSTPFALCPASGKVYRTDGGATRPGLLRLFATESLHISATSRPATPSAAMGDAGFDGAPKITNLGRRPASAPGSDAVASSRPRSASSDAARARRHVCLGDFAAGVSEIENRPRSRSRSGSNAGGGSAAGIRAAMTMLN